jgi:pyruvate kinase
MVDNTRPTRAEAADVANAVLDGSDALMLSEETAVGKYPAQTVQVMSNIIREAEKAFPYWRNLTQKVDLGTLSVEEAVSHAGSDMAYYLKARAIITPTESGRTARLVSKYRPKAPILAITRNISTQRQLQLSWGVFSLTLSDVTDLEDMIRQGKEMALDAGWVCADDIVVFTAGLPLMEPGNTNLIKADKI